jgi:DNA-binding NarL/FixJ family response regulator
VLALGPPLLAERLTHRTREMLTSVVTIARADTGDDEHALTLGRRGLDAASDDAARSMALWALAETHWLAGRAEAIATADAALALEVGGYPGRVQAVLVGQWARHDQGQPIDPRSVDVMALAFPNLRGAIAELEGLRAEDPFVACVAFETAAGQWAAGSRRAALRSRWAAGEAATRAGDADRALTHLEAVDAECAALGLAPLRRRVQRSLRALGRRPARTATQLPVSEAQLEVLRRIARGQTTHEIARALALEPSTIESHVRAAMRATGAFTRLQAAASMLCAEPVDTGDRPNLVARTTDALDAHLASLRSRGVTTLALDEVPDEPWALDALPQLVTGAVHTTDDASNALFAAARGAQVAVLLPDDLRAGAFLLDGLTRVGPVRMLGSRAPVDELLDPLELRVLELLAAGRTITEIAKTVGYSRRTIQRRLVETRKRLGVATNAEALIVAGAAGAAPAMGTNRER